MADMTKQRLIGALLVLSVILIAALMLVKNANNNIEQTTEVALPEFESSIQTTDNEIIDGQQEALIDPHGLGQDVAAAIEDDSVREVITAADPNVVKETKAVVQHPVLVKESKVDVKQPAPAKLPEAKPAVVSKPKPVVVKPKSTIKKPELKQKAAQTAVPQTQVRTLGPQWTIQLASFGVKDNATALQKKIKKLGYQANIQGAENSQGKMIYRVRIGPESSRQSVDAIVSKVKQHLQLTPQVIKLQ